MRRIFKEKITIKTQTFNLFLTTHRTQQTQDLVVKNKSSWMFIAYLSTFYDLENKRVRYIVKLRIVFLLPFE